MKYIQLGTARPRGRETTADDPQRGVWFSQNPYCGYWTDDWDALSRVPPDPAKPQDPRTAGWKHGVPCCPHCQSTGLQTTYFYWLNKAKSREDKGFQNFLQFTLDGYQVCGYDTGLTLLQRYRMAVTDDRTERLSADLRGSDPDGPGDL